MRHPDQISNAFRDYYSQTFKPKSEQQFDNEFLSKLDWDVKAFMQSNDYESDPNLTENVQIEELKNAIQK